MAQANELKTAFMPAAELLPMLQPGDIIQSPADHPLRGYQSGIYVGRGEFVHVTGVKQYKSIYVGILGEKANFMDYYRARVVRRNNSSDKFPGDEKPGKHKFEPKPREEIVESALAAVGREWIWFVVDGKSQDFAWEMRYGVHYSPEPDPEEGVAN